MRRRTFLWSAAAALAAAGFARPEHFPFRRARIYDHGSYVSVTVAFPELLRRTDRNAMAWLDSGFETVLRFRFAVLEHRTRRVVERREHVVTVRFDYLQGRRYEVRASQGGRTLWRRTYDTRDMAVAAAVRLQKVPVARTSSLVRAGARGPAYFVAVVAQRNPIDDAASAPTVDPAVSRAQSRDVEWFGRLVGFLVGEVPDAEVTIRARTQPFYLEVR